jgi:FlaG/FlaF family flagellin (archaellin)
MKAGVLVSVVAVVGLVAVTVSWSPGKAEAEERFTKPGKIYTWNFAADTLEHKPVHSVAFGGTWKVLADSADTAQTAKRFLRQTEDDDGVAFHYLSFTKPTLDDVDVSVRFRIVSGEIDPAVGILFQMDRKGTSGYLVRVSGKSGGLVFHYLLYGRRRDLRFAKTEPIELMTWHTISISRKGSVLRASLDGKERMMVRDERSSKGTVGLWTEDDTVADFKELAVTVR